MTPPIWHAAYDLELRELSAWFHCRQCRALDVLRTLGGADDLDSQGRRVACREVLREPHGCGRPTRMVGLAGRDGRP
jgi:hypothetical protein